MNTEISALEAQLEMANEIAKVEYDALIADLDVIVNKYFVTPHNSVCTRRWMDSGFDDSAHIDFEIGFKNELENRIDFGSDMWFEFDSKRNELRVNHGTCGYFSKSDIYQVRRVELISYVFNHILEIEQELRALCARAAEILNKNDNIKWDIEREITRIKKQEKDNELSVIESNIKLYTQLSYAETCEKRFNHRLFNEPVTVTHITPKYITVNGLTTGRVMRLKKADLLEEIYRKNVI